MTPGPDDRDVDELVRVFARKVATEQEVRAVDLAQAAVVVVHGGAEHRLWLPRPVLAEALQRADDGDRPLGADLAPVEACARLMTVHLHESWATRDAHASAWWSYDGGCFEPEPPWEVHRRSRG